MGLVIGEDLKWVLNPLPVALPKRKMGHVFWITVIEDSLIRKEKTTKVQFTSTTTAVVQFFYH